MNAYPLFAFVLRFVQYKATSLEKQHKHDLLTEPDLGVTIDLINPDTYRIDPNSKSNLLEIIDLSYCNRSWKWIDYWLYFAQFSLTQQMKNF